MNIENVEVPESIPADILKAIFDKQKELVEKYKEIEKLPTLPLDLDIFESQVIIKDFKQRGMEEIAEGIEAWRADEVDHFKEELIDALHFFTELCILVGKDSIDYKSLDLYKLPKKSNLGAMQLYYNYGVVAEKYGLMCNTLKNKPWKQTQMLTDKVKFYLKLKEAYEQFIKFLFVCGLTKDDIYRFYFRKHKVNEFRIESKY